MRKKWRSFEEAREFAKNLDVKSRREWLKWSRTDRPDDIPAFPDETYQDKGWQGWGDFLGTGNRKNVKWRSFEKVRKLAKSLNLKNQTEWHQWAKTDKCPDDIPVSPNTVYKDWQGWGDFLGTGNKAIYSWLPFEEAREFARSLGLKNWAEWNEWAKTDKRPDDIPYKPSRVYKKQGWQGMGDWLGK